MDTREREEFVRAWGSVLMKSWEDDDFKARLHADPKAVLQDAGMSIQDDATVTLESPPADAGPDLDRQIEMYAEGQSSGSYVFYVQDTNQLQTQEISERELEGVSAGACCCSSIVSCCCC